jgi:hypothetical protein
MGDFDQILYAWLGEFPKGHVPTNDDQRIQAYRDLLQRSKQNGLIKEFFLPSILAKIVTESINPNHPNRKKRNHWAQIANKHLKMALHSVYTEAVPQEENPLDSPLVEVKPIPEIEEQIEEHNEAIKPEPAQPRDPKKIHYADTVNVDGGFGDIESVNVIDPEMAALLGFKIK